MIDVVLNLLVAQALLGAFDTVYHHELKVALPQQLTARRELAIHGVRALLYGTLFAGLAWFQWFGLWVVPLVVIILVEVGLTLWDFVVEDATRVLPKSERVTHTLLAINGGAAFGILALELPAWYALPTNLASVDYGWESWFLTGAAIGVGLSGLRDGLASWNTQRLDLRLDLDIGQSHGRLLISGGTGFIGSALCHELLNGGHQLTLLTRDPVAAAVKFGGRVRCIRRTEELSNDESFDAVINLAGAPVVGQPWSAARKRQLLNSRLGPTGELLAFVRRATHRPAVWLQASAIGYYGTQSPTPIAEDAPLGRGFAARLCGEWESMSRGVEQLGIRCVTLRFGLVFGRSGGSLPRLLLSQRFGLGMILGDGSQRLGWIHIEDLLQMIARAIADRSWTGVINAVAPDSPTYQQFVKLSGHLLHRPWTLRLPRQPLLRFLGEMATLFIDGPHIVPKRLTDYQFEYRFPTLRAALMDLL